ncbi:hypothetical protein [Chryseobacterium sp. ISL-6]|uniref:hypothetical protein n=1 Tax=Chryseobacterium sp. ISL-6 TaxID=2819143 RepID=UPI001BEBC07E|nr:hypothetical protein [Chryseobacterium sp. ISL-6]MBT2620159.1 hypothetical protein [Chryseobacterium sp. ISL-6]
MKKIFIINLVYLLSILSCKDINKFSGGSYPYAETYVIPKSEKEVINTIIKLKEDNLDYKVPKLQWAGKETELLDGRDSHWYYFYFYFKDTNDIVEFWTREGNGPNETKVGFFSVSKGLNGSTHLINKDLSEKENTEIKRKFEKHIIDKIK